MRLIDLHENDEEQIKQTIEKIKKYCQPFLNQLQKPKMLFRGSEKTVTDPYQIKETRKGRTPVDTPEIIHNIVNEWFKKHFNINYRSDAIFTVGDTKMAKRYGNIYAFFPIGNFNFVWSKDVSDLFSKLKINIKHNLGQTKGSEIAFDKLFRELVEDYPEEVKKITKELMNEFNYTNKNLDQAINSGHEVMVDCEKYIIVSPQIWDTQSFEYRYEQIFKE